MLCKNSIIDDVHQPFVSLFENTILYIIVPPISKFHTPTPVVSVSVRPVNTSFINIANLADALCVKHL